LREALPAAVCDESAKRRLYRAELRRLFTPFPSVSEAGRELYERSWRERIPDHHGRKNRAKVGRDFGRFEEIRKNLIFSLAKKMLKCYVGNASVISV
jgi:hypothetical protein